MKSECTRKWARTSETPIFYFFSFLILVMRIRLNITKSMHENAASYYEEAKDARNRMHGVLAAIDETTKEMAKAAKHEKEAGEKRKDSTRIARKKEWHEKFHYFFTDSGLLLIGGRSADQNDLLYKTQFDEGDLFFHADIQGGTACVMKDGIKSTEEDRKQAAQFAACFSNAWKNGNAAVDVYCVKREQVSKNAQGGFIAKGAFAIIGEREWFRKTELKLKIGMENGAPVAIPFICARKLEGEVPLAPGRLEKGELTRKISKRLKAHPDDVQGLLPPGRGSLG